MARFSHDILSSSKNVWVKRGFVPWLWGWGILEGSLQKLKWNRGSPKMYLSENMSIGLRNSKSLWSPFQRSDSKNHLHTLIPSIFGRLDVNYCSIPAPRYVYLGPYDPMKFSHPPRKCGSKPCTKANLVGNIHHTTKRCFMGSPERGLTQNKMHPAESQSLLV